MAALNCLMHTFSMKKIFAGAIYFGLLGSLAAHAQSIDGNADAPFALKGSESLGEAASQTALQTNAAGAPLPETNSMPFTLKVSESFVGVPLAEVLPTNAPRPMASLPTPPPATVPIPSVPLAVAPHTTEKQPTLQQTASAESEADDGAKFGIAPIRWGGDVSEALRWRRFTTGNAIPAVSTLDNMQIINLRASSYIWQPWIATVDGGWSAAQQSKHQH